MVTNYLPSYLCNGGVHGPGEPGQHRVDLVTTCKKLKNRKMIICRCQNLLVISSKKKKPLGIVCLHVIHRNLCTSWLKMKIEGKYNKDQITSPIGNQIKGDEK